MHGDLERAADYYAHPLAVYHRGEIRTEHTRADTLLALADRRSSAMRDGTRSIRVIVEEVIEASDGRKIVKACRHFLNAQDVSINHTRLRYFLRRTDHEIGWRIEMMELIELGYPSMPLSQMAGHPKH